MPFDPNSAVLAKPSFDPGTAREGFDPETATEAKTAVFGAGTKLRPDTAPEYTLTSALRGLQILGRNYAPAALQVHEANRPSEFLQNLMPGIEAPDVSIPISGSPVNFNPSIAVAPINALSNTVVGLSNPEMAPIVSGMGAVSAAGRLVPAAQQIAQIAEVPLQGYFAADMTKAAMEGAKRTGELAADPNATLGQTIQSGLETGATALFGAGAAMGAVGGVRSIASTPEGRAVLSRIADKTPEQAVKTLREAKSITEDQRLANALTDAADSLERQIQAKDAADKIAAEQQKTLDDAQAAQEKQAKAVADIQKAQAQDAANAAKATAEAAKPPEIPKSAQILAENAKPPAIANVATEIGTQTSPFAVQAKINELTAPPPAPQQIAPAPPEGQITQTAAPQQIGLAEPVATGNVKGMTQPGIAPIVSEMIGTAKKAAADLRGRITDVALGPIEGNRETITFNLDGKPHVGVLKGRNRDLVPGVDPEADAGIAARVLIDGDAKPMKEAPKRKSYGEKYIADMGVAGGEKRIAHLIETAQSSRDPRQIENLYDEADNIRRAIEKNVPPPSIEPVPIGDRSGRPQGTEQAKLAQTKSAVKNATDFQYTVFRPGEGIPDAIQVDAIGPKGEALGSSNVADLNKAGAKLPEVPDWVPQGKYTLGEMKNLVKNGEPWVRGESQRNANGDLFFSTSGEIAGDFGETRKIKPSERPKKTLMMDDKPALAEKIGYSGDPLAEPLNTPIEQRFDTLAKAYAKKHGYDSIRYTNGTFGEPELHIFKQGEPTNALQEPSPREILQREPSQTGEAGGERGRVEQGQQGPEAAAAVNAGNEVRQGAVPESLSKELRLNNADIGMKPVSEMKPAELIAELEAGGANATPKGIPISDANSAQLKDAVGKLRRGQYATTPTDIIDVLQSKKRLPKRPRGEVASAGPDLLYDAAHDAALDVAILGIRAGRSIAEIIRMAIAKFKAMHPGATEEQIAALTKDIVDAHGTERTTPLSEAEQMMATASPFEAVGGRSTEDTQAAARMRQTTEARPGLEQTETATFKKWFGDSKVVDAEGKPLVVYKAMYPKDYNHPALVDITEINRPTEFPAFNKGEKGVKIAGFFGDIPTANRFAESAGTGQAIFPTYLSLKKPFVIEADGRFSGDVQFGESGKEFRDAIRSGKYDGVIIKNTKDEGTVYVALSPTQIKSAIGNSGNFDATSPSIIDPIAGRAPVVTQAAAARRSSFANAEAWADRVIKERGVGSGALNTIDPELLTAHTVKLIAQLERGTVDFAKWSAEKIKEAGEAIRPYLQQIWDTAHAQLETQRTMSGEERGVSKSALGKYDYIKTTNKGQIEAAQPILDYVKQTGDFNGGFARLAQIENTADRGVAAAVLLREAESIPDPYLRDRVVARLAREAKNAGTDAAQGLQAQGTVNDILTPYRGHLAWMDIIQSKFKDKIEPIFGADAADKVNAGFKEAGNRAAAQIDAPGATSLLSGPIARIKKASSIDWRAVFTDLPEKQAERKAEIFNRIKADPMIAALPPETQTKLASAMEAAWEHLRNNIFRQDFSKLVPLPNIKAPDRIKLEETLPELTKQANLGLLDNEAFMNALANRYGIERLDSETGAKLRELGQKAARTPEGSERNEVFQQILDTIMKSRGVKPFDFLTDFWYRNVMSAPRTAVEIGAGGIIQGAARTFLTAADTAIMHGRPDLAFRMTEMFMRDMGVGAALGADLIKTGDRAILPRYTEQFLAKMDKLEKGKSPGGEIESLYRRSGTLGKIALSPFEMVGRALTALDYIGGQGVRNQQMLYAALTRGDKVSFDAAMKQFDAKQAAQAWIQAKKELPGGRAAQWLARAREIMNKDIDLDIRKFGNHMTEVTALNAVPVGISGLLYRGLSKLPMWVRAPTGLGFVKAALNLVQEYSNYAPITGQINAARTFLPSPKSENIFNNALSLKDLPPERRRQIIAAQATGLVLLASAANRFLGTQPEDKKGIKRAWEISGPWIGLTPAQKSAMMSAGEKPYAIRLPSGRWVDYKLTPFVSALAMIGHVRDQERFNNKKWSDEDVANKAGNAWLAGLTAVKDLSLASQFSAMAGILAADSQDPDMAKGLEKKLADTVGNAATGLIPMNSLLRELDNYGDQQRYQTDRKNPGVDIWLKQVPFVRRTVNDGKPMLNFLGKPVEVVVTPFNRHIGELPATDPVEAALSDKVSLGMKLPALSQDTTVVGVKDGKPVQRPMTQDEGYFYQKSVRQAYARQLASDLAAFRAATPEQAALYSQVVMTNAERYVRDRMNTGKAFDGVVPVDPRLSSALTPEYQQTKELNSSEAAPSALAAGKLRIEYDRLRTLPEDQKQAEYQRVAREDPQFAVKLVQYANAPEAERTALDKSEASLGAESRAQYIQSEMAKLPTAEARQKYLSDQFKRGLINTDVLTEMANGGGIRR